MHPNAVEKYKSAAKSAARPSGDVPTSRITGKASSSESKTMLAKGEDYRWTLYQDDLHIIVEDEGGEDGEGGEVGV